MIGRSVWTSASGDKQLVNFWRGCVFCDAIGTLAKQAGFFVARAEPEHGTHAKGVLPRWDLGLWLTRSIAAGELAVPLGLPEILVLVINEALLKHPAWQWRGEKTFNHGMDVGVTDKLV